jgi:hypothetical protein
MNESEPLRDMLANLARGYTGATFDIEFKPQPSIDPAGDRICVWTTPGDVLGLDLDTADEYRIIRDSLNHECAHYRHSDLEAKERFAGEYENDYPHVAGTVLNILEDAYIDSQRLERHPGLRYAHAFFAESQLDDDADVSERDTADALVRALHQLGVGGRVVGITDADDTVREFAAWALPHVEAVREADTQAERLDIAARVHERLLEDLPERPDASVLEDIAELGDMLPAEHEIASSKAPEVDPDDVDAELPEMDAGLPADTDADAGSGDEGDNSDADPDADAADGAGDADDADDEDADADDDGAAAGNGDDGTDDEADTDTGTDTAADPDGDGDAAGDDDGDGEPSTGGTGEAEHGEDPDGDDLADVLDDLEDADAAGERPEWHGLEDGDDYEEPSAADVQRAERAEARAAERNETKMGERRARRDDRLGEGVGRQDRTSDEIRDLLRETGLATDVRRAFERFASEDITVRRESGDRLNTEAAVRHVSGDYSETAVYEQDYTAATGGRTISVALDLSGSMRHGGDLAGGAIVEAKVALGALHIAAEQLGDTLTVSGFWTPRGRGQTPLVTGPAESFEWEHLDAVTHGSGSTTTPTAHGILDALELAEAGGGEDRIVIVLTDGIPKTGHPSMDGVTPAEQAGHAARIARQDDTAVIGLGVGKAAENEEKMRTMFGSDYVLCSTDTLTEELVAIYENQLDFERPRGF